MNSRLDWAHARDGAVEEIPLLRDADDTVVTVDDVQALAENDSVGVAITTVQPTPGGAGFSLAKLLDGHVVDTVGTIVPEDRPAGPNLLAGVDCGGPILAPRCTPPSRSRFSSRSACSWWSCS